MLSRLPLLARLSRRYALRHKGQTLRAVLGLLVATTVLTVGLGMGESISTSLEREALSRFGPIDIIVSSGQPFEQSLADGLPDAADAPQVRGGGTLALTGSVSNPRPGLAEAFATVRGAGGAEDAALGPLHAVGGAPIPDPGPGQVVVSNDLAASLDVQVGDTLRLRVPRPSASGLSLDAIAREETPVEGLAGPAVPPTAHAFAVRDDAVLVAALVNLTGNTGTVTATLRAPSGIEVANVSTGPVVVVFAEPPVEAGEWTLTVTADRPVRYAGAAGAGYVRDVAGAGIVVLEARVAAIADAEGRMAITNRPTALVPLGDLQSAVGEVGRVTHAYYTASGDPYAARQALEDALPDDRADGFQVRAQKADAMADAAQAGAQIAGFLLVMGGFTIIAAVLLAFTLFSALVEERRAELGIARALGMTRGEVALSMTMEGALYAFFAALVGLLLGLALLWGLMLGVSSVAAQDEGAPDLALHVSPGTIATAFLVGALIPLVTIGLSSLRFARLDPARAIRGIPDDPKGKRRTGLVIAGLLALAGGLLSIDPILRLAGVPIALAGAAVGLYSIGWRAAALLPAAAGFAHAVWTLYAFDTWPQDAEELDPILTLARGGIMALGLAALAVASTKPYEAALRAIGRGGTGSRAAFIALKYLVSRRRPVGLTIAMIAMVVVIVTVMGTLFVVFGGTIQTEEAGYQVLGEAPVPVLAFPTQPPADVASGIERADFLPRHVEFRQANLSKDGADLPLEFGLRSFVGVTPGFAEANRYALDSRASAYGSDREAWDAVVRGEAMMMPSWMIEEASLAAGDRVELRTALLEPRSYVIAGGVRSQFTFHNFVSVPDVQAMGFPQSTQVLVRIVPGADIDTIAHRLADIYGEEGLSFTSVPEEVARVTANVQAIVLVFEAFLALGLFVGLAATGFLAARAVHERMRDIGTLRALGFEERDVRRAFMLESTLTSGIGLLLGLVVGLVVAHSIWWREVRRQGVGFEPPWLILGLFAVSVLALAAWASRGPAKRAAALAPAIAVRHVE